MQLLITQRQYYALTAHHPTKSSTFRQFITQMNLMSRQATVKFMMTMYSKKQVRKRCFITGGTTINTSDSIIISSGADHNCNECLLRTASLSVTQFNYCDQAHLFIICRVLTFFPNFVRRFFYFIFHQQVTKYNCTTIAFGDATKITLILSSRLL